jgi:arginase family enzyme
MTTEQQPAKPDTTMWTSLLHAGLSGSFLKLPHVAPQADALREHGARAAIYGIPWDSTSISRTGANYGPRGIRKSRVSSSPTTRPGISISSKR